MATHGHAAASHGASKMSPTYRSWKAMKQRCVYKRQPKYRYYGARGVRVADRWLVFENFLADLGERPEGTTLGRLEDSGDYEPGNAVWMTHEEQLDARRAKRERERAQEVAA